MQRFNMALAITAIALMAPAPTWAGDRETAQQIADAIRESGSLNGYAIGVKFQDGTVWLKGKVRSGQQMARAVEIAERTSEVNTVVNQLEVPTEAQLAWSDKAPSQRSSQRASRSSTLSEKISYLLIGKKSPRTAPSAGRQSNRRSSSASSRRRAATSPALAGTAQQMTRSAHLGGQLVSNEEPVQSAASTTASPPKSFTPAPAARVASARGMPGAYHPASRAMAGAPMPTYVPGTGMGVAPAAYDHPHMPNYAWPSYAAHPNYAGLTYPRQYSPTAWPYIGPFYPYPQVPLGWRKVTLEWDDGWWFLDFDDKNQQHDSCWWW